MQEVDGIHYLGVYRDGTGYGTAALHYILALDRAGAKITCRSIRLQERQHPVSARITELEGESCRGSTLIQHTLPSQFEYHGNYLVNLGLFHTETSSFVGSGWAARCNLLDGVIVSAQSSKLACERSGVKVPIAVVPVPCDLDYYQRSYPLLPHLREIKKDCEFLFYTVGEAIPRKNLVGLLQAYLLAFAGRQDVGLVFKTSRPGMSQPQLEQYLTEMAEGVARELKIPSHRRPPITFLTDRFSPEQMASLHLTCDCFVTASLGEGMCLPAMDALGFGRTPIVPSSTAFLDYVDEECGWLVPTRVEPIVGAESGGELYLGEEQWYRPDVLALAQCMKVVRQEDDLRREKSRRGLTRAELFSYEVIGPRIQKVVADAIQRKVAGLA